MYYGGLLQYMEYNNTPVYFTHAPDGTPMGMLTGGNAYFYITNLQGDVTGIVDQTGNLVVSYTYDAWGNPLSTTLAEGNAYAATVAALNPLRYRGYVYDAETGLYYVSSRYYDAGTGRFLNSDILISTGQGLLGYNMFAYCRNNPVRRVDVAGTADQDCYNEDGELFSSDDLEDRSGGGGAQVSWGSFMQTMQNAADGLAMASGGKVHLGYQKHHILSNKHSKYTPQYKEIADRYNFKLSQVENTVKLQGHCGGHTTAYHEGFALPMAKELDKIANGSPEIFKQGMSIIGDYLYKHSWIPYARYKEE